LREGASTGRCSKKQGKDVAARECRHEASRAGLGLKERVYAGRRSGGSEQ